MSGRLSPLSAALVVARRDFQAILFSRSFLFFLIGPLFMLAVSALASGVGQRVEQNVSRPVLGVAMAPADAAALTAAAARLDSQLGGVLPQLTPVGSGTDTPPAELLHRQHARVNAVLGGTLLRPTLTGPREVIEDWQGPVALIAAAAASDAPTTYPAVALSPIAAAAGQPGTRVDRMRTAQAGQTLLFLLTMLLAGMVLSNLVEEKANKIIEVLAAAVPMDAVFLGKLFAMLAVSFVGIAVWAGATGVAILATGQALSFLPPPAVGWPMFLLLGIIYFAMAYLLLGSLFLTIGSLASTVREVQTLSMPVTMMQLLVFFFASYVVAAPHSPLEMLAVVIPVSSPFAMLARAALDPALGQHAAALAWQTVWVALFVRFGARLFRRRVMKSGPAVPRRWRWGRARPAQGA